VGDALAKGGLPHPRWPDGTEDGALPAGVELEDRQVFEDALLDFLEPVVILVEDPARLGDVDLDGLLPSDGDRRDHAWEQGEVPDDDDGEGVLRQRRMDPWLRANWPPQA
jgi:hypothetical protein